MNKASSIHSLSRNDRKLRTYLYQLLATYRNSLFHSIQDMETSVLISETRNQAKQIVYRHYCALVHYLCHKLYSKNQHSLTHAHIHPTIETHNHIIWQYQSQKSSNSTQTSQYSPNVSSNTAQMSLQIQPKCLFQYSPNFCCFTLISQVFTPSPTLTSSFIPVLSTSFVCRFVKF